jgi:hypothetical protein
MAVAMRDKWTDEWLDDLKGSVDDGFKRVDEQLAAVDRRFDRIETKMAAPFARIDERLDGLSRAVMLGAFTLSGAMLTGFIAIFTLIATRL